MKPLMVRLGYSIRELTGEEMEDMGLLRSIVSEKNTDYVAGKNPESFRKK